MSEVLAEHKESNCVFQEQMIKVTTLARAYVPMQHMCEIYNGYTSLVRGTIYPELDKPYKEKRWEGVL